MRPAGEAFSFIPDMEVAKPPKKRGGKREGRKQKKKSTAAAAAVAQRAREDAVAGRSAISRLTSGQVGELFSLLGLSSEDTAGLTREQRAVLLRKLKPRALC